MSRHQESVLLIHLYVILLNAKFRVCVRALGRRMYRLLVKQSERAGEREREGVSISFTLGSHLKIESLMDRVAASKRQGPRRTVTSYMAHWTRASQQNIQQRVVFPNRQQTHGQQQDSSIRRLC